MLKQVQHDSKKGISRSCHPEPGSEPCPESSSGSIEFRIYDFGISLLVLNHLGSKAPAWGVLYS
jgi:hypothetical protein